MKPRFVFLVAYAGYKDEPGDRPIFPKYVEREAAEPVDVLGKIEVDWGFEGEDGEWVSKYAVLAVTKLRPAAEPVVA